MSYLDNKILYISLTNGAGGAEQILMMCAKITNSKVVFLKKVSSGALLVDGKTQTVKFLNNLSIFIGFLLLLKELISYRKNYVIISSHPYLNGYLGFLKRVGFIKSKLVTRECTSVFLRFSGVKRLSYKLVYSLGYPAIDLLVCQTDEMKAQLMENLAFLNDEKVVVLKNPLDLAFVKDNAELIIVDPIFQQDYICSAGRLIRLKGFDILISSFAVISQDYPKLKLLILGDGEEKPNLERLVKSLNLENKVILIGFVSNPFPYFKNARLCVVSSIREGFPNVLLQMMSLNSSVVTTLCADGIDEFDSIIKVKANDQAALSKGIKDGIEKSLGGSQKINNNLRFLTERTPQKFINSVLTLIDI